MTTESQDKRYRDGYAAGRRDGTGQSGEDAPSRIRPLTGDEWADNGYSDGFSDQRDAPWVQYFSGLGRVLKDVLWIPEITGWLHRRAGSP